MEFVRQKVELCKFRASVSTSIFFLFSYAIHTRRRALGQWNCNIFILVKHTPRTHTAGYLVAREFEKFEIIRPTHTRRICHRTHTPQGIYLVAREFPCHQGGKGNSKSYALHTRCICHTHTHRWVLGGDGIQNGNLLSQELVRVCQRVVLHRNSK